MIDPSKPLLETGYLDSLSIAAFVAQIQRIYGIKIHASQLTSTLETIDDIADHIVEQSRPTEVTRPAHSAAFHIPLERAIDPVHVPSASTIESSQMTAFARFIATREGTAALDGPALHSFSVEHFRTFWKLFVEWSRLPVAGSLEPVCEGDSIETARFFPELRLNYTACLLRPIAGDDAPALTACNEAGNVERFTRGELRERVLAVASRLRALGVVPGDRVVAIARNDADAVIACLATVAIGGVWSSVSPDLGAVAILARVGQLEPRVLFACTQYLENGRSLDVVGRVQEVLAGMPTTSTLIVLGSGEISPVAGGTQSRLSLRDLEGGTLTLDELELFPFNHPLFILFSSGTTGRPKCIMHGAGGTLIEHCKEHVLHTDLRPGDKLFFQTSCAWMMWNWQLSALATGATIVVYDGSVMYPDIDVIWHLLAREKVTVFGTSPAYLQLTHSGEVEPSKICDLSALRAILSTGAVLPDTAFDWIVEHVRRVPVQSISGGTDIIGCFLLGHPNLPVYAGELQSKSLGLDVRVLGAGPIGELVCWNPFPSRPIGLYGDPDRFHDTYFAQNAGLWTHGDRFEWTARETGRIHGRSDGVMNVRGVRIGPAEIHQALAGIETIVESMAVEQRGEELIGGSRILLLLVLARSVALDDALAARVRASIAERCSRAHVPDAIIQVAELPTTHNGKRAERAARDAVNGATIANLDALRNPTSIDAIRAALARAL